jgi:hypothetical protein
VLSRIRLYVLSRETIGMIAGSLALFIALGGVGYANKVIHLIDGSTIKKGSIPADRLTQRARVALKGQTGARGPRGLQGIQGIQGMKGDSGAAGTAKGYAFINADGSFDPSRSHGIVSTSYSSIGVRYCVHASFAVQNVIAGFQAAAAPVRFIGGSVETGQDLPCGISSAAGDPTWVAVNESDNTGGSQHDRPFYLLLN